jgi:hypothetical protein
MRMMNPDEPGAKPATLIAIAAGTCGALFLYLLAARGIGIAIVGTIFGGSWLVALILLARRGSFGTSTSLSGTQAATLLGMLLVLVLGIGAIVLTGS